MNNGWNQLTANIMELAQQQKNKRRNQKRKSKKNKLQAKALKPIITVKISNNNNKKMNY